MDNETKYGWNIPSYWRDWFFFIVRLLLGFFLLVNALYQIFGLFGGPGLDLCIDVMTSSGIPLWLSYFILFGELVGSCSLILGCALEIGFLLVVPWGILFEFFSLHSDKLFSIEISSLAYGPCYYVGAVFFVFCALLCPEVFFLKGPGKFVLWDPFKKFRSR